jgi:HKD family nuclease
MIQHGGQVSLVLGSANLTRRNLNNFNLEANVSLTVDSTASLVKEVEAYFDRIWTNRDGNHYTVGYEAYRDDATLKRIIYLVQEYGGLSSF